MRTVDADALLNDINERYEFYSSEEDAASSFVAATLSYIADVIKDAPTIEPEQWIPVTEKLPRDDEEVIVTCLDDSGDTSYSYTTVAWHYKDMWVCDNMRCPFVIAWMPRPKPWRGEKHEL